MAEQQKYYPVVSQGADSQHPEGYTETPQICYAGGGVIPLPPPPPCANSPQQGNVIPVQTGSVVYMQPATGMVTMPSGPPPPTPPLSPNPCFAIWLGICATICFLWLCGIPAIVLGTIAWQQPRSPNSRLLSTIGVALGGVGCGLTIIFILAIIFIRWWPQYQSKIIATDCTGIYTMNNGTTCWFCTDTMRSNEKVQYYKPNACEKFYTTKRPLYSWN